MSMGTMIVILITLVALTAFVVWCCERDRRLGESRYDTAVAAAAALFFQLLAILVTSWIFNGAPWVTP